MKGLFVLLISLTIVFAQVELDEQLLINSRWVNEKGWPIPDVEKMEFEKSEVIKDIIPEWICVKTFIYTEEDEMYILHTNKIESGFTVKEEIGELEILSMDAYSLCETKKILFYVVTVCDIDERDENGISGLVRTDIYVDLNQDGIYESRFEESDVHQALKYFAEKWRSEKMSQP